MGQWRNPEAGCCWRISRSAGRGETSGSNQRRYPGKQSSAISQRETARNIQEGKRSESPDWSIFFLSKKLCYTITNKSIILFSKKDNNLFL